MPECYTHVYLATQAQVRSGLTVASLPGLMAGANGPDVLAMYQAFKRVPQPDLPGLSVRMHHEATGAFLMALITLASTPVQQSYTLGFVSHYIADCTLHPYIAAMSGPEQPYAGKNGFLRMEASLDSTLYYRDYKTACVPLHAGTPVLISEDLAQVSTLLQEAIQAAYGLAIPQLVLADTWHDNAAVREILTSRSVVRHAQVRIAESYNRSMGGGFLTSRLQPAPLLKKLPKSWVNPYSAQLMELTLEEVLALAAQSAAVCLSAVMRYWLGEVPYAELAALLGNNDYYTGQPCHPALEDIPRAGAEAPPPEDAVFGHLLPQPEAEGAEAALPPVFAQEEVFFELPPEPPLPQPQDIPAAFPAGAQASETFAEPGDGYGADAATPWPPVNEDDLLAQSVAADTLLPLAGAEGALPPDGEAAYYQEPAYYLPQGATAATDAAGLEAYPDPGVGYPTDAPAQPADDTVFYYDGSLPADDPAAYAAEYTPPVAADDPLAEAPAPDPLQAIQAAIYAAYPAETAPPQDEAVLFDYAEAAPAFAETEPMAAGAYAGEGYPAPAEATGYEMFVQPEAGAAEGWAEAVLETAPAAWADAMADNAPAPTAGVDGYEDTGLEAGGADAYATAYDGLQAPDDAADYANYDYTYADEPHAILAPQAEEALEEAPYAYAEALDAVPAEAPGEQSLAGLEAFLASATEELEDIGFEAVQEQEDFTPDGAGISQAEAPYVAEHALYPDGSIVYEDAPAGAAPTLPEDGIAQEYLLSSLEDFAPPLPARRPAFDPFAPPVPPSPAPEELPAEDLPLPDPDQVLDAILREVRARRGQAPPSNQE